MKEAVRITGKSDATLRRWLKNLPKHEQKYIMLQGGRISIDKAFLLRCFDVPFVQIEEAARESDTPESGKSFERVVEILSGLVERLQAENKELREQLQVALLRAARESEGTSETNGSFWLLVVLVVLIAGLVAHLVL